MRFKIFLNENYISNYLSNYIIRKTIHSTVDYVLNVKIFRDMNKEYIYVLRQCIISKKTDEFLQLLNDLLSFIPFFKKFNKFEDLIKLAAFNINESILNENSDVSTWLQNIISGYMPRKLRDIIDNIFKNDFLKMFNKKTLLYFFLWLLISTSLYKIFK